MSVNYYGYYAGQDPAVDEGVHLCQSAIGCEMLLQALPEDGITDIRTWLRQLGTFESIRNEYGEEVTIDELLEWIENRLALMKRGKLKARFSGPDHARFSSSWTRVREFRSGGAAFASYHFS
jgi:hypothetical protein